MAYLTTTGSGQPVLILKEGTSRSRGKEAQRNNIMAARVIGEATPERIETVRKATVIVERILSDTGAFQYMAILNQDRVTGMRHGKRDFGQQLELRCWDSVDARTATPTRRWTCGVITNSGSRSIETSTSTTTERQISTAGSVLAALVGGWTMTRTVESIAGSRSRPRRYRRS